MFTFRTLQPSHLSMLSVFAVGSAMSSSSQRRPACNGCDQGCAVLGTDGAGVLRRSGSGHENFAASGRWCLVPRHFFDVTASLPFGTGTFCVGKLDE